MKTIYSKLTKRTFVHHVARIAKKAHLPKVSIYLTVLSAVAVLTPYIHIFYNHTEIEGIFGFNYMASFLWAISLPFCLISFGLILRFISENTITELNTYFKYVSTLLLLSGFFFLLWAISAAQDFDPRLYYYVMIALSIILTILSVYLNKLLIYTEKKLKENIKDLISHILYTRENYISPNDLNQHDEKMFKTLKKVTHE